MSGVTGVSEAIKSSKGVGGLILSLIYLGGTHYSTPPTDGIFMSKDECMSGSTEMSTIYISICRRYIHVYDRITLTWVSKAKLRTLIGKDLFVPKGRYLLLMSK